MSEEKWKCPKCGAENAMDDNFCGECGSKKPEVNSSKPDVGIGMAQTVNKQETVEKEGAINESTSEKPKKKSAGKIVLILAAVCVVLMIVFGVLVIAEEGGGTKIGSLYWSKRSRNEMTWNAAVKYCQNLSEGGYSDWRLPNIDELRTTIKNCSKTETGGECKVSEKNGCLSWEECGNGRKKGSCYCEYRENNGGYYSKLGDDDKVWLWSSSVLSGIPDYRWFVLFNDGSVISISVRDYNYVRCVR